MCGPRLVSIAERCGKKSGYAVAEPDNFHRGGQTETNAVAHAESAGTFTHSAREPQLLLLLL